MQLSVLHFLFDQGTQSATWSWFFLPSMEPSRRFMMASSFATSVHSLDWQVGVSPCSLLLEYVTLEHNSSLYLLLLPLMFFEHSLSSSCRCWFLVLPYDFAVWDAGGYVAKVKEYACIRLIVDIVLQTFAALYNAKSCGKSAVLPWCIDVCFLCSVVCSYWTSCQWFTVHASSYTVCKQFNLLDLLLKCTRLMFLPPHGGLWL